MYTESSEVRTKVEEILWKTVHQIAELHKDHPWDGDETEHCADLFLLFLDWNQGNIDKYEYEDRLTQLLHP